MFIITEYFTSITEHLLRDESPSEYLNKISEEPEFRKDPLNMLYALKDTPQSPVHHPEGSVWNHTMLVVDEAAKRREESADSEVFMWSALLHDIGKGPTTKLRKGKVTSYDHDRVGKDMSVRFLLNYTDNGKFIEEVAAIVRWHMQPLFIVKDLPFSDIKGMLSEVDLEEITRFSLCDRLGRGNMTREKAEEEERSVGFFYEKCKSFQQKN